MALRNFKDAGAVEVRDVQRKNDEREKRAVFGGLGVIAVPNFSLFSASSSLLLLLQLLQLLFC